MFTHYRKNLGNVVRSSAAPYGYTLSVWTTGAALIHVQGIPAFLGTFGFALGSVLGFFCVGVLAFGGMSDHVGSESGQSLLWGSLHFLSVGLSVGVATLVAHAIQNVIAWPVAGFLTTTIYLLGIGAESTAVYLWEHRTKAQ